MQNIAATAAISLLLNLAAQAAQAEFNSLSQFTISTKNVFNYDVRPYMPQDAVRLSAGAITEASYQRPRVVMFDGDSAPATNLKHLIGWAEAGRNGYDAVQHGARIGPGKRPTQMTIGEIKQWIRATPGQPHAIGRYQFIPATLDALVREIGFNANTVFTADVQDRLADLLLEDAGYSQFVGGKVTRHQFMQNLAKIWAGFPTSTGQSFYHGYAGNYATIGWNEFDHHMASIFKQ